MTLSKAPEELIQRCIDGELTAEESASLHQHLEAHPDDAARLKDMQRHAALIKRAVPNPSATHMRDLRNKAKQSAAPPLRLAASIAILTVGIGFGYIIPRQNSGQSSPLALFASQAQAAHSLYVSEVLHPVEVGASEVDHLQNWLSNRLGAPIIAPQLGETGYALIGGRLLPAGDKASALFMYENAAGDRVSLLATHIASTQSQSFRFQVTGGYTTVFWQDGPWQYSLVGSQQKEFMGQIARVVYGQLV